MQTHAAPSTMHSFKSASYRLSGALTDVSLWQHRRLLRTSRAAVGRSMQTAISWSSSRTQMKCCKSTCAQFLSSSSLLAPLLPRSFLVRLPRELACQCCSCLVKLTLCWCAAIILVDNSFIQRLCCGILLMEQHVSTSSPVACRWRVRLVLPCHQCCAASSTG